MFSRQRIFTAILLLGLFILTVRGVHDPDVWWHLRNGEYIVQNHTIPHQDIYSFTKSGQQWIAHEWLSDAILYMVYRSAGWVGLNLLFGVVIGSAFLVTYLRSEGRPYIAALVVLLGTMATGPTWGVRPQMFSLLLAAVFLALLAGIERGTTSLRALWWPVPLTLLWANLHAGYAVGLALIASVLAGNLLECGVGSAAWMERRSMIRTLALVFLACIAVVAVNPNGAGLYLYPLQTLRSPSQQGFIVEWASPNFHHVDFKPFLALFLLTFAAVAASGTRLRASQLLMLLGTAFAALTSSRHIPLFVLVATPVVAQGLADWLRSRGGTLFAISDQSPARGKLAFYTLMLVALAGFVAVRFRDVIRSQPKLEATYFPVGATNFLAAQHPAAPIFNYYDWGGYFIWKLYPGYLVFIDGRADLYGDELMDQFARTASGQKNWQEALQKYAIRTIVIPPNTGLAGILRYDAQWTKIFEDSQAVVYVRNTG